MKKLYRKGSSVHPSPTPTPTPTPTPSSPITSDQFLSILPSAIFALAVALSPDDKHVLAYLLSCSTTTTPIDFNPSNKKHNTTKTHQQQHQPCFTCYCFTCYTSYWSRWDSSPNRHLIHEIIDAFEDYLLTTTPRNTRRPHNKKKKNHHHVIPANNKCFLDNNDVLIHNTTNVVNVESGRVEPVDEGRFGDDDQAEDKPGSVRKMVSFLWGTLWG